VGLRSYSATRRGGRQPARNLTEMNRINNTNGRAASRDQLADPRRRAALVCFLWQSYRDAIDQAVDMWKC
jgi:hypothetical protein